jgi:hypothetical protein
MGQVRGGIPGTRAELAESTIEQENAIRDSYQPISFNETFVKM